MKTLLYAVATACFGIMLVFFILLALYLGRPDANQITQCPTTSMNNVVLCEKSQNYVRLSSINQYMIDAVLISEDAAFYHHNGFDLREIENSFWTNIQRGELARGGSTITQQLVKNVFLSSEKSFTRKITEALLTHELEQLLSKKQILEYYMNVVEFGPGIYGVKRAASHYFGKHPSQLSLSESAYLAFLLPSPKVYSRSRLPDRLTAFANSRIRRILANLRRYDRVSESEYLMARRELGDDVGPDMASEDWSEVSEDETEMERMLRLAEEREANLGGGSAQETGPVDQTSGEAETRGETESDVEPESESEPESSLEADGNSEPEDATTPEDASAPGVNPETETITDPEAVVDPDPTPESEDEIPEDAIDETQADDPEEEL